MTVSASDAAASGDRRQLLVAIRAKLAFELDGAEGRDAATIGKQLAEVARELDSLPTAKESTVDDLVKRRASRRATASGQ